MDEKAIKRAQTIGWQIAEQYGLDHDDCSQEAIAVALEVFRDAGVGCSAGDTLWNRVHNRLVGRRGSLRYTFPVGCDGPKRECQVNKDGACGSRGCGRTSLGSSEAERAAVLRRMGVPS